MGRLGFEPRTNRLKAEYSTVELATLTIQSLLPLLARVIILPRLFKKDHHKLLINVFSFLITTFCKEGDSQE